MNTFDGDLGVNWHNQAMSGPPLAVDTPPEIEAMQIEGWRRMTPTEKAALISA